MTSVPMDNGTEKKRYLLEMLSIGLLDKDGARELKPLLEKDLLTTDDLIRKNRLSQMVNTLNAYLAGKINLMMEPYVPAPSNTI
jgi:hypothetical protein